MIDTDTPQGAPLRVLVVEDEWMLADELRRDLEAAGATVLGPVGSVDEALRVLSDQPVPDAAVLDVNLNTKMVFPVATALRKRGVPFVFTTGYDCSALPDAFAGVVCFEKPVPMSALLAALIGKG